MKKLVEAVWKKYEAKKDEISRGFIKIEHIEFLEKELGFDGLNLEGLEELRKAAYMFFDEMYCVYDRNGELVGFKPWTEEIEFARDSQSAWMAVFDRRIRKCLELA